MVVVVFVQKNRHAKPAKNRQNQTAVTVCPLYRLKQFLEGQDIELLLGENIPMCTFSDSNLGRALDALHRICQTPYNCSGNYAI